MSDQATLDANKQLARDYFKAFGADDREWMKENIAEDYVRRDSTIPFECVGPEGVGRLADVLHGAFSQIELDIQDIIAEGDKVLVHLRFRGVQDGAFGDHPASNKRFDVMVLDFFRMKDGKVAEQWPAIDNLGLQQQIGAI